MRDSLWRMKKVKKNIFSSRETEENCSRDENNKLKVFKEVTLWYVSATVRKYYIWKISVAYDIDS